jgi:hypothetical protein
MIEYSRLIVDALENACMQPIGVGGANQGEAGAEGHEKAGPVGPASGAAIVVRCKRSRGSYVD